MKRIFTFAVNNGGTLSMTQTEDNGPVQIESTNQPSSAPAEISAGDMVMLINLYRHIKRNNIQDDFLNCAGKDGGNYSVVVVDSEEKQRGQALYYKLWACLKKALADEKLCCHCNSIIVHLGKSVESQYTYYDALMDSWCSYFLAR
ncbi:MAG: hypothetical protein IKN04_17850 [Clostridia bacterium]|nr:hypothetical protein [Clostridia bacterium]